MDKYELVSTPYNEASLFYSAKSEREQETGCVGHMRMDFGRNGDEFWTSWEDHCAELKTQSFKDEFDDIINTLKKGVLANLSSMTAYCYSNKQARFENGRDGSYGYKIETDNNVYYLRCSILKGDYNLYIYAYERDKLEKCLFNDHLKSNKTMHLINAYEKLHHIPEKDRYSSNDDEKLCSLYEKALAVINMDNKDFQSVKVFDDEQRVFDHMRSCIISKSVNVGDDVICIPTCPFQPDGSTHLKYERIEWIDDNKLCGVKSGSNERRIPLWQVLARFNKELLGVGAFNIPHAELLFLNSEDEAMPLFLAVQKQYDNIFHSLNVMTEQFEKRKLNFDNGQPLEEKRKLDKGIADAPKEKPSLMDKVEEGKQKAARQEQPDKPKNNKTEALE